MEVDDITESSLKFHYNQILDSGKALYQVEESNGKILFRRWSTPETSKLMLKIHLCRYEDSPEISSPLDEESWETAIKSLTDALIYTVKSDIVFALEF